MAQCLHMEPADGSRLSTLASRRNGDHGALTDKSLDTLSATMDLTLQLFTVLDTWLPNGRERMLQVYSQTGSMTCPFSDDEGFNLMIVLYNILMNLKESTKKL